MVPLYHLLGMVQRLGQHIRRQSMMHQQTHLFWGLLGRHRYADGVLIIGSGIKFGIALIGHRAGLECLNPVQGQIDDGRLLMAAPNDKPAVVEFLEQVGMKNKLLAAARFERLVLDFQCLWGNDGLVKALQMFQSLEVVVALYLNDRWRIRALGINMVFQFLYQSIPLLKMGKAFKLFEQAHRFVELVEVLLGDGAVGNAVIRIRISIIAFVHHNDGGIVSQFIAAHGLEVQLHRASAHPFVNPFILIQGRRTSFNEILQSPTPVAVL